jgi:hypothetical protein
LIEQGLARGRNGKAIWQDLVSDHGFAGGYQAVKRFVRTLRGPQRPEAAGIILTAAGEEAQVDYGSGPMVRDAQSGKYRRTRLFVMTLGYSRKSVRLLTWRSSSRIWAELHEKALRRLGGCPNRLLPLYEYVESKGGREPLSNPTEKKFIFRPGCRPKLPAAKASHAQKELDVNLRHNILQEALYQKLVASTVLTTLVRKCQLVLEPASMWWSVDQMGIGFMRSKRFNRRGHVFERPLDNCLNIHYGPDPGKRAD